MFTLLIFIAGAWVSFIAGAGSRGKPRLGRPLEQRPGQPRRPSFREAPGVAAVRTNGLFAPSSFVLCKIERAEARVGAARRADVLLNLRVQRGRRGRQRQVVAVSVSS